MTDHQKQWIAWGVSTIVVLALSLTLGIKYPLPTPPEELPDPIIELGTSHFTNISAEDVTATDDLTVTDDATLTDDVAVGGDLAVTGDATLSGDVLIDDTFSIDDTDSTIVGTQTLTPTATYYQLAPVSALTLTLATGSAVDGDLLILHNTVATNTIVVDTGATVGGGNITLAANDLAIFVFGNSKWVELASPDNS
jgi:hypothetical protein